MGKPLWTPQERGFATLRNIYLLILSLHENMGYAVLHLEKTNGSDSGMTAHIERTISPKNADPNRTHLNKELIQFPEGVLNRTQAIQQRLYTAGLKRKIGQNQVIAVRIRLTVSHNDMKQTEQAGKLGDWCNDHLNCVA